MFLNNRQLSFAVPTYKLQNSSDSTAVLMFFVRCCHGECNEANAMESM